MTGEDPKRLRTRLGGTTDTNYRMLGCCGFCAPPGTGYWCSRQSSAGCQAVGDARAAGVIRRNAGHRCQEGVLDLVEQIVEEGAARKAIARAVDAIAEADGGRGAEHWATICTGTNCIYLPDPSRPRPAGRYARSPNRTGHPGVGTRRTGATRPGP